MVSDAATFFWSFLAIFGALGWYLWHLERKVDALRRELQAATGSTPGATTVKDVEEEGGMG